MNATTTATVINVEVRYVGPYRVVSNGRKVLECASRIRAEKAAAKIQGATVQGRRVEVTSFGSEA